MVTKQTHGYMFVVFIGSKRWYQTNMSDDTFLLNYSISTSASHRMCLASNSFKWISVSQYKVKWHLSLGEQQKTCTSKTKARVTTTKGLWSTSNPQNVKKATRCNNRVSICHGGGLRASICRTIEKTFFVVCFYDQFNILSTRNVNVQHMNWWVMHVCSTWLCMHVMSHANKQEGGMFNAADIYASTDCNGVMVCAQRVHQLSPDRSARTWGPVNVGPIRSDHTRAGVVISPASALRQPHGFFRGASMTRT